MPAKSERALYRSLGEYDWDDHELDPDRLEELQRHNETRRSKDGFVIINDPRTEKTDEAISNVRRFTTSSPGSVSTVTSPSRNPRASSMTSF